MDSNGLNNKDPSSYTSSIATSSSQHTISMTDADDDMEVMMVPRRDKGKGKMRYLPELPDEVWQRIWAFYYGACSKEWQNSGIARNTIVPLLLSADHTRNALPVFYSHPHVNYNSIPSFLKAIATRSPWIVNWNPPNIYVRHLTIRASSPVPAYQHSKSPSETPVVHTLLPRLLAYTPRLLSIYIKDTLVMHSTDANTLFSALRQIKPKKARLEFRMWDLADSPYGEDLMTATRPHIHSALNRSPTAREKALMQSPRNRRLGTDPGRLALQEQWRDALWKGIELDLPQWWIDIPKPNTAIVPQQAPIIGPAGGGPGGGGGGVGPSHLGGPVFNNTAALAAYLVGGIQPLIHQPNIHGHATYYTQPSTTASASSQHTSALAGLFASSTQLDLDDDDDDESSVYESFEDAAIPPPNDHFVGYLPAPGQVGVQSSRSSLSSASEDIPAASGQAEASGSTDAAPDNGLSSVISPPDEGESVSVGGSSSASAAIDLAAPIARAHETVPLRMANLDAARGSMLTKPNRVTSFNMRVAQVAAPPPPPPPPPAVIAPPPVVLSPLEALLAVPHQPVDGLTLTTSLTSFHLAHHMRGQLRDLITNHWSPELRALSIVAFDPLATILVRSPRLDLWVNAPIPHIRIHLPRGINSLAVFKGTSENALDRRLNRRIYNIPLAPGEDDSVPMDGTVGIVGGDGYGGGLIHDETKLFEIEVNTIREMDGDLWDRAGGQLPPQLCRLLVGEEGQSWDDVTCGNLVGAARGGPVHDGHHGAGAEGSASSAGGSDWGGGEDMDWEGDGDEEEDVEDDEMGGGGTYDRSAAEEQERRIKERKESRERAAMLE